MLKALMLVMLALAAAFVAGMLFVQSAHAGTVGNLTVTTQNSTSEDITVGDYTYTVYYDTPGVPGSVWIKKYNGSDAEIIIPTSFEKDGKTYPLAGEKMIIGVSAFEGNTTLKKVAIPEGVSMINNKAFAYCTSLEEAAIHNDVEYIADDAFEGCPNLKIYRVGGTGLNEQYGIGDPGIGQDADGKVYPDVTVVTVENSPVDKYVKSVNEESAKSGNGNQIALKYEANPYANHTVKPTTSTETKGADGTAYGAGASESVADKAITKYASETDPKGTVFNLLKARATKVTKNSVTLAWSKAKGATKYIVYGNACGKKNKMIKQTTVKKNSVTFKKVNKKAVKKGTYYKFTVVAVNAKGKVVTTSKMIHVATPGGKWGNDKKVTTAAKKNAVSVKVKKTFNLKAKAVAASKKLKVQRHRQVAYESTNPKVASVSAKGVIKGVKKGTCYVYAYAQNGVSTRVKVTVK